MKTNFLKFTVATLLLALVSTGYSVPTVTLSDGVFSYTFVDNSTGDSNPLANVIDMSGTLGGALGNWFGSGRATITGSLTSPTLKLDGFSVSSHNAGTLNVSFSDTVFGPIVGTAFSAINGSSPGGVAFETFLNAGVLSSSGVLTGSPFSFSDTQATASAPNSTLGERLVIGHGSGQTSTLSAVLSVPDHVSTWALLVCVVGVLFALKSRKAFAA